jgi:ATP-dependent helicase/nuclease subunit A
LILVVGHAKLLHELPSFARVSAMPETTFPKTWHEAVRSAALPWQEEAGKLVLGETFPTAPRAPVAAAPTLAAPPSTTALATPTMPNPAQSPEQQRGEWLHLAIQGLPCPAPSPLREELEALATHVRTAYPWLFGPGSRAEVALTLPNGTLGRLDRLAEQAGALWVIDFKTGTPQSPLPRAYQQQLASYVAALQASFPHAAVRAALLWVDAPVGPTLVELAEISYTS